MKRKMKGFAAVLALTLCACGSSGVSHSEGAYDSYASGGTNSFATSEEAADYAPAYGIAESTAEFKTAEEDRESETDSGITGVKLVYTGSITIETLTYPETVTSVRERISSYKGIVEREDEWDGDHSWYYTDGRARTTNRTLSMTVRIPTKDFDAFMNDMDGAGKVTSRSQNVENISRRYSDNSIEIESLELQQTRLLEMMEKAETVEEMIMIEERLSNVQTQLNQKKSYRSSMDTDVEYSTVYLNINEVQKYTPVTDPGIQIGGFGERLLETLKLSGKQFVYFLQNLVLFLVEIAPFVLLAALLIFLYVRHRRKKGLHPNPFHREKKQTADVKKEAIDPGEVKK
jgi:hypothetical protein